MCDNKPKDYYYLAADKNGDVFMYAEKPKRCKNTDTWTFDKSIEFVKVDRAALPEGINPQWSDTMPIKVHVKFEKRGA